MSLYISSINSGSNGNCYYIGNQYEAVLVDAGISCRETEKRMKRLGLDMHLVKAIFVSHEHADHITGIPGLSKKFQIPVYITEATLNAASIPIETHLIRSFLPYQPTSIGSLEISAFPKQHDARDPHSFIISGNGVTAGVFTDIGKACSDVIRYFSLCNAVFLESNYCPDLLAGGNYPQHLKARIRGGKGHLSNSQALELFTKHKGKQLSHLILSHLSKNNNRPELVEQLFKKEAFCETVVVASRYGETPVYCVSQDYSISKSVSKQDPVSAVQLSLFES